MEKYITQSGNIHVVANTLLEEKFKWAYEELYNSCISIPNTTRQTLANDGTIAQAMYIVEENILLFILKKDDNSIRSFINIRRSLN